MEEAFTRRQHRPFAGTLSSAEQNHCAALACPLLPTASHAHVRWLASSLCPETWKSRPAMKESVLCITKTLSSELIKAIGKVHIAHQAFYANSSSQRNPKTVLSSPLDTLRSTSKDARRQSESLKDHLENQCLQCRPCWSGNKPR